MEKPVAHDRRARDLVRGPKDRINLLKGSLNVAEDMWLRLNGPVNLLKQDWLRP